MSLLVRGIGELVTNDPALGVLHEAALVVSDGRIAWVGADAGAPAADEVLDVGGAAVLPGFVDSHTHLVFAGDRAAEFAARMAGQPYTGGGIRTTVAATRAADNDVLRARLAQLRREALRQGTTTLEVKSGYGLTVADEARLLRLAREVTPETTFLGAHVVPVEYADRPDDYVDLVCGEMLRAAAPYARWVDVFCERGVFDADQSRAVLKAGIGAGLRPRLHANQLGPGPGIQVAVEPGAEFSTRSPYPDARALLDAGATVALATDCNPGSSYTSSMPLCIALAVREMRMTPAEAVWAATAGGARALRRTDIGHLGVGARADLAILDAPSHVHLAYRPGVPLVSQVLHNGVPILSAASGRSGAESAVKRPESGEQ